MNDQYESQFAELTKSLTSFIGEVMKKKISLMATDEWSVKDELAHITFWHETYAANYKAQVEHTSFELPSEMSTINRRAAASFKKYSRKELLAKLDTAHKSLYSSIVEHKIKSMIYSKGGRTYETGDFLEMISRHITTHAKLVKRAR